MDNSERVVLRTGRVDIIPGQTFRFNGRNYQAITYPHGAGKRIEHPGIWMDFSPPYDPNRYIPSIGELTAVEIFDGYNSLIVSREGYPSGEDIPKIIEVDYWEVFDD